MPEELVKLIWDFRGPDSLQIAKHHVIHLDEYIKDNAHKNVSSGLEEITDMLTIAYLIVEKNNFKIFRDELKPHRGEFI
ncbi:MAG: hypothetical protein ACPGEG_04490 [Salibacteraceae bacterium]